MNGLPTYENTIGLFAGVSGSGEVVLSFDPAKSHGLSTEPFKLTPDSLELMSKTILRALKGLPAGQRAGYAPMITESLLTLWDSSSNFIFSRHHIQVHLGRERVFYGRLAALD